MTEESFGSTPLFQLNLMLFLAWPAPPSFVSPVFRKEGFVLESIAPPLSTPLQARARAQAGGLPIGLTARPDVLLRQQDERQFLLIECKKSSFGPGSDTSEQARALLACSGIYLAERIGLKSPEHWKDFLLYVVTGGQEPQMQATLQALALEMEENHISTSGNGAIGVHIRGDGVYLVNPDSQSAVPVDSLRSTVGKGLRVMELEEGEDPRPLYLIPLDPSVDVRDPFERRVLEERVRQALTSLIGSRLDASRLEVTMEEIMVAVTEVWEVWEDSSARKGFRNAVRAYVREVLRRIRRLEVEVELQEQRFVFKQVTPDVARRVRRYLTSVAFRRGQIDLWTDAVQLDFGSLAEEW